MPSSNHPQRMPTDQMSHNNSFNRPQDRLDRWRQSAACGSDHTDSYHSETMYISLYPSAAEVEAFGQTVDSTLGNTLDTLIPHKSFSSSTREKAPLNEFEATLRRRNSHMVANTISSPRPPIESDRVHRFTSESHIHNSRCPVSMDTPSDHLFLHHHNPHSRNAPQSDTIRGQYSNSMQCTFPSHEECDCSLDIEFTQNEPQSLFSRPNYGVPDTHTPNASEVFNRDRISPQMQTPQGKPYYMRDPGRDYEDGRAHFVSKPNVPSKEPYPVIAKNQSSEDKVGSSSVADSKVIHAPQYDNETHINQAIENVAGELQNLVDISATNSSSTIPLQSLKGTIETLKDLITDSRARTWYQKGEDIVSLPVNAPSKPPLHIYVKGPVRATDAKSLPDISKLNVEESHERKLVERKTPAKSSLFKHVPRDSEDSSFDDIAYIKCLGCLRVLTTTKDCIITCCPVCRVATPRTLGTLEYSGENKSVATIPARILEK